MLKSASIGQQLVVELKLMVQGAWVQEFKCLGIIEGSGPVTLTCAYAPSNLKQYPQGLLFFWVAVKESKLS